MGLWPLRGAGEPAKARSGTAAPDGARRGRCGARWAWGLAPRSTLLRPRTSPLSRRSASGLRLRLGMDHCAFMIHEHDYGIYYIHVPSNMQNNPHNAQDALLVVSPVYGRDQSHKLRALKRSTQTHQKDTTQAEAPPHALLSLQIQIARLTLWPWQPWRGCASASRCSRPHGTSGTAASPTSAESSGGRPLPGCAA